MINDKFRMSVREKIVQLITFPDDIKEYDSHVICTYGDSDIIIDFYRNYITIIENYITNDCKEVIHYADLYYLDILLEEYEARRNDEAL